MINPIKNLYNHFLRQLKFPWLILDFKYQIIKRSHYIKLYNL